MCSSDLLERISSENDRVLIFVATKRTADELTNWLRGDGWPALAIHGDKEQPERDWVMMEFKAGKVQILIATDVASRGIGASMFDLAFSELCSCASRRCQRRWLRHQLCDPSLCMSRRLRALTLRCV